MGAVSELQPANAIIAQRVSRLTPAIETDVVMTLTMKPIYLFFAHIVPYYYLYNILLVSILIFKEMCSAEFKYKLFVLVLSDSV